VITVLASPRAGKGLVVKKDGSVNGSGSGRSPRSHRQTAPRSAKIMASAMPAPSWQWPSWLFRCCISPAVRTGASRTSDCAQHLLRSGTSPVVFSRGPGGQVTALHFSLMPMSFQKRPDVRNPRPWVDGAIAAPSRRSLSAGVAPPGDNRVRKD